MNNLHQNLNSKVTIRQVHKRKKLKLIIGVFYPGQRKEMKQESVDTRKNPRSSKKKSFHALLLQQRERERETGCDHGHGFARTYACHL